MAKQKTKLFVTLTTTHGIMPAEFLGGIMDLLANLPCQTQIQQFKNCYVNLSTNVAAAIFLDTDYTHMIIIDVDIIFRRADIERLLLHDVDIVGGFFPKKRQDRLEWVCNSLPHKPEPDHRGLVELETIGAGCLMIKREVFERMRDEGVAEPYSEYESHIPLWDFFPIRIKDGRMRTHDWYFCDKAREMGYKVYGDTKVVLGHWGGIMFPLESQKVKTNEIRK